MSENPQAGGVSGSGGGLFQRFKSSNNVPTNSSSAGLGGMKRSASTKQLAGSSGMTTVLGSKGNLTGVKRQLLPNSKSKEGIWKQFVASDRPHVTWTGQQQQHRQQSIETAALPQVSPSKQTAVPTKPSSSMGLRSPTPKPSTALKAKRVLDSESDRPAKRQYTGASAVAGVPSSVTTSESSQARSRVTLKPRRSVAFSSSTTSNNISALDATATVPQARQQAQRASLAPPSLPSSACLLSFSPSKLGLTQPREFTFSSSVSSRNVATSFSRPTSAVSASQAPRQLLAPSPIRPDEHIPKLTGALSRSQTSRDGFAVEERSAPPSARPYLSPSTVSEHEESRRTISPVQKSDMWRSDLMRRSLEGPEEKETSGGRTSPFKSQTSPTVMERAIHRSPPGRPMLTMDPASPSRALLSFSRQDTSPKPSSLSSVKVPTILFPSQESSASEQSRPSASSLLPPVRLTSEISHKKQSLPPPSALPKRDTAMLSSPVKRSRSPEEEPGQPSRAVRQRKEGTMTRSASASTITRSMSTRALTRKATRAVSDNVTGSTTATAPVSQTEPVMESLKRSQTQAFPATKQTVLPFQTVEAAPQTATSVISHPQPASVVHKPVPADETMQDSSESTVDMDTSIMSAHGHESLSNLNALLSKMSIPRRSSGMFSSRRSSLAAAAGSMNMLDERAEMEEEILAEPTVSNAQQPQRYVPRYAAATASSSNRHAGLYQDSRSSLKSSTSSLGLGRPATNSSMRRSSVGVPGARKGSLLPLASSSNAAKTVMKSSMSVAGGLSSLAGEMEVDSGVQKSPEQKALAALEFARMERCQILKDVVAYVDVKTAEGDEAGGVFVDILRSLGARVLARPTDNITHIIFKGGRPATIHRYRAFPRDPKPFLVGVGWIVSCREKDERVSETGFLINPDVAEGALLGSTTAAADKATRRKSLEPRMLLAPPRQPPQHQQHGLAKSIFGASKDPNELDRARRRSLQFAPRIGSPLKQRVFNAFEEDEEGIEAD